MRCKPRVSLFFLMLLAWNVSVPSRGAADETMTITTYVPPPIGIYDKIKLVSNPASIYGYCHGEEDAGNIISFIGSLWLCGWDGSQSTFRPLGAGHWKEAQVSGNDRLFLANPSSYPDIQTGIGTSAPEAFLHIRGEDAAAPVELRLENTQPDSSSGIALLQAPSENDFYIRYKGEDASNKWMEFWGNRWFDQSPPDYPIMTLQRDYNPASSSYEGVGIGVPTGTQVSAKLEVWTTAAAGETSKIFAAVDNDMDDDGDTSDAMEVFTVMSSGNVGIKESDPQAMLHIGGNGELFLLDASVGWTANETDVGTLAYDIGFGASGGYLQVHHPKVGSGSVSELTFHRNGQVFFSEWPLGGSSADLPDPVVDLAADLHIHQPAGSEDLVFNAENMLFEFRNTNSSNDYLFGFSGSVDGEMRLWGKPETDSNYGNSDLFWKLDATGWTIGGNSSVSGVKLDKITAGGPDLILEDSVPELVLRDSDTAYHTPLDFIIYANEYNFVIGDSPGSGFFILDDETTQGSPGAVGIGKDPSTPSEDPPGFALDVDGHLNITLNDPPNEWCYKVNDLCVANYTSDSRVKRDIRKLPPSLEKITSLQPVQYTWAESNDSSTHVGLIAQDVEKVYPQWVTTNPDGYKAIKLYGQFDILLIESLKELKEQTEHEIESLKDDILRIEQETQSLHQSLIKL